MTTTGPIDSAIQTAAEKALTLTDEEQIKSVETSMEVIEVPSRSPQQIYASLSPDVDSSKWPTVRLNKLRMMNFGPHRDVEIEFGPYPLHSVVGPNGIGKTTLLTGVQLLFGNFSGYDKDRYLAKTLRMVRNWRWMSPGEQATADFSVWGQFEIQEVNGRPRSYEVELRRQGDGFIGEHPGVVRFNLPHYCFMARFDQELHLFQLRRSRWTLFKELFEAVTGFEIEEDNLELDGQLLSQTSDRKQQKIIEEYVLGFRVHKPREIITQKQCSAGERKIAKSLSTILNKPVRPNIILIDNLTDHVELARHLPVMEAIERCFPTSQIIATCHSQPVQRRLPNRDRLIDLRFLTCPDLVRREPWRMRLADEVDDSIDTIHCLSEGVQRDRAIGNADNLGKWLRDDANFDQTSAIDIVSRHIAAVAALFAEDTRDNSPAPRIRSLSTD